MMLDCHQQPLSYLFAEWAKKPESVQACTTLVTGGISANGYAQYNLATHVDDDPSAVKSNREKLIQDLGLPAEPVWLEQVHGDEVVLADEISASVGTLGAARTEPLADASVSRKKGVVCAVLTADCLPVFFCNRSGTEIAVAHAGWRGLHSGVISTTINKMRSPADDLLVSLGPAIGPQAFEVGEDVFRAFFDKDSQNKSAFREIRKGSYLCDIYQLARIELQSSGVDQSQIAGGGYCTFSDMKRFYSFRRQKQTGRMASLIWLI